ncbi:MAG TPA: hypothetical protein VF746_27695 [Longimicrobium sp.]|jgi:hypothetical protein
MSRISIDEFRARLAGPEPGALLQAYRELARRPDLRHRAAQLGEWIPWGDAQTPRQA